MTDSLIPKNVMDEFRTNLRTAGGSANKLSGARRMVGSRLIIKNGMKWWNEHEREIKDWMDKVEKEEVKDGNVS
jgi:hypothetical protein